MMRTESHLFKCPIPSLEDHCFHQAIVHGMSQVAVQALNLLSGIILLPHHPCSLALQLKALSCHRQSPRRSCLLCGLCLLPASQLPGEMGPLVPGPAGWKARSRGTEWGPRGYWESVVESPDAGKT